MEGPDTGTQTGLDAAARRSVRAVTSGFIADVGGITVRIQADGARAAAVLVITAGMQSAADGPPPVAEIRFLDRVAGPPQTSPDVLVGDVAVWWVDGGAVLRHEAGAVARVTPTAAEIGGDTSAPAGQELAYRPLFTGVLSYLLAHRDRFVVHGAAVTKGDRAVLALGSTGMGKSTLAVAAHLAGWAILSDDLVVVHGVVGRVELTGIPRPVAVPDEVVTEQLTGIGTAAASDPRRRRRLPLDVLDHRTTTATTLVVVGHGGEADAELVRVDRLQMLQLALGSFLWRDDGDLLRRYFSHAAALSRLPCWELRHARDPAKRLAAAQRALATIAGQS